MIPKGFSMSLLCISDVAHGTPDLPTPFITSMRISVCRVSSIRTPTSFCHLPQELSHVLNVSALVLLLPLHLPSQRCALLMLEEAFNPNTQVDLVYDIYLSENFLIFGDGGDVGEGQLYRLASLRTHLIGKVLLSFSVGLVNVLA